MRIDRGRAHLLLGLEPSGEVGYDGVSASCGIESTGTAFCWGAYLKGGANYTDTPIPVAGGLRFRTVSAGKRIACGLTTSEVAYCWRTGDDLRADSIVAVKVPGQS